MKASIHPTWHTATIKCACGNTLTVGSTKSEIRLDICSKCHPFFTGEMKFVDTMGRVERFQAKQKAATVQASQLAQKKQKEQEKAERIKSQKSLKDMLMGLK